MGVKSSVGARLAPIISEAAPSLTVAFVREALHRAVHGIGPLPPAAAAADKQLAEQRGDVDRAIHEVIENHVRYAGAQGFVTNMGGLVTATVTIPANITGLALVQCRMIAGIAHLRGYDLHDPRVKNAVLSCILGEETIDRLVSDKKLPAPPMALATAPAHDPELDTIISAEVASDLISRVAGKRLATTVGRRVPVVGGLVGMGADGFATWKIGRYADRELLPRPRLG
ncbi:MAG: EcsC family protein [Nocardioidaceae bacterium]